MSAWAEPLYSADEMRRAEEGHDVAELMQRAGRAVADHALAAFPEARRFAAVCGGGANGGDGRIAVDAIREAGREAVVVELGESLPETDVILDALFGTGFVGEPRPDAARRIEELNARTAPVIAVDVPSGVDASTGEVRGAAVEAHTTVTFHGRKVGLAVAPGSFNAGEVVVVDIGLTAAETRHRRVTEAVLAEVPRRGPRDNKYTAGAVVVVGGSRGLTGAACLAAEAAFRADAGYVAVAVPASTLAVFETRLLEAVKRACPENAEGELSPDAADEIVELAERARAVAIGPGLGRGDDVRLLVRRLLGLLELPVVVDADALFGLRPPGRRAPTVLTPHEGELARLLDDESGWVAAHRLEAATRCAERFGTVCLLKGSDTIVASPDGRALVCDLAPPSLATAGTGDVLTGILAAFLAKGLAPEVGAAAAAVAHARAAVLSGKSAGLIASDVVDALPLALTQ